MYASELRSSDTHAVTIGFRLAGGFLLIVPSVAFIFAVRRYLFAMWGIANR